MGSLQRLNPPPFSGGDLISLLQAGSENKTVCACACVCFSPCLRFCACAHATWARQTFPISALRFEKRGRKSQSSSYYSSLKENGEAEEKEGGRDRWREEKREPNGRDEEGVGGYINSYLTVFGFLHPGMRSFSPLLSLAHFCFLFLFYTPFLPFLACTPQNIMHSVRMDV